MDPLLRTQDLTADPGMASSVYDLHPIGQSAPPRPRLVSILFTLGLTPLLICGLANSLISPTSTQVWQRAVDQARKSVSLLLQEPEAPGVRPPARNPVGPDGPGGAGHREGTGALDPRLATFTSILLQPSDAVDPKALSTSPRADAAFLSLNPAMPLQDGGNGLARGTGRDPALGQGGLLRLQESAALNVEDKLPPDGRLVPIRRQPARHVYKRGELPDEVAQVPVIVRVVVDEKGNVTRATILSGPEEMRADALWAAKLWTFEPLGPHGLKAPLSLDLIFRPRFSN